jgi:hypothetical protein
LSELFGGALDAKLSRLVGDERRLWSVQLLTSCAPENRQLAVPLEAASIRNGH